MKVDIKFSGKPKRGKDPKVGDVFRNGHNNMIVAIKVEDNYTDFIRINETTKAIAGYFKCGNWYIKRKYPCIGHAEIGISIELFA